MISFACRYCFLLFLTLSKAFQITHLSWLERRSSKLRSRRTQTHGAAEQFTTTYSANKRALFDLLDATPSNAPTPRTLTQQILAVVEQLEQECPTPSGDVLKKLSGPWELLWTTQDVSRAESRFAFLNPIENQQYSNNPNGRANPVLPRFIQDKLESMGIIQQSQSSVVVRSTQSIDLAKQQVVNLVGLNVGTKNRAAITVSVDFKPNPRDPRKIDVKFRACRLILSRTPINLNIPLGVMGPTGWLRISYIDDTIRITRGHKGSVFVLQRPA
jgi:hypothetical protein